MPIYPPRKSPIKKLEELKKVEALLANAIKNNLAENSLIKLAEKYKLAQHSMLKAKIHVFNENVLQKKENHIQIETLEAAIIEWTSKTHDQIINEVKADNRI